MGAIPMATGRILMMAGALLTIAVLSTHSSNACAEAAELRVAKQYGLGYLQFILMEDQRLIEKHAQTAGLGDIKVTWATFRSSDVMNDGLISGTLDFACLGVPGLATIWARTRGNADVRAASGLNLMPLTLVTRNPAVRSIRDIAAGDRIALPAVKVSMQAILLQMAAAKEFGDAAYAKLDSQTVSMAHPDALTALLSGAGEVNVYFSSQPFTAKALERPGIRRVVSSTEILGGPISFNVVAAPRRFQESSPKLYGAFLAALAEATTAINRDKRAAAEIYLRVTRDKSPVDEILKIINDPETEYTLTPRNLMQMVNFMAKQGTIKAAPASWKDLFFPNAHTLPGS